MKKAMLLILSLLLCLSTASATILPATGVDEDFRSWTGIECAPAVILCQSISVYDARGDQGGKKVDTLRYTGKTVPVIESWDGWAKIYYSDGNKTGWVHNEYLMMDPAWYLCDEGTAAYAYPDAMAPRVAWLAKGTRLPILTEYADGGSIGGWVCVSLRGAAGWIRKTPKDTADQTWFRPQMLQDISSAVLTWRGESICISEYNPEDTTALSALLTNVNDLGAPMVGCPFEATLELSLADGRTVTLQLATDSCCVYRVDGRDYQYARHLKQEADSSVDNAVLLEIFGLESWTDFYLPGNG